MRALHSRWFILVPLFLAAQAMLVHWAAAGERLPPAPDLKKFPAQIAGWKQTGDVPVEADVVQALRADRLLNRMYMNPSTHAYANLFLAWFDSQRGGAQPHSPKVCLPGAGWVTESSGELTLSTAAGPITVNRMLVADRSQRAVVLYWYQNPRRVTAGEWESKFWVVADAVRYHRTDIEMVRVVVWQNGSDEATLSEAARFAQRAFPVLRRQTD